VNALSKPLSLYPAHYVPSPMAPVVRIEPNDNQTLLLFNNAREDLENSGWLIFIQKFEGFNLSVTHIRFLYKNMEGRGTYSRRSHHNVSDDLL
jgi:hypothetical protein